MTLEREGVLLDLGKPLEDPLGTKIGGLPTLLKGTLELLGELQSTPPIYISKGTISKELRSKGSISNKDKNFVSARSRAKEELLPIVNSPSSEQGSLLAE